MKIVKVHHADHGVPFSTLEWALERIAPPRGFFAVTVDLPDGHEPLLSALYGPLAGDPPVEDEDGDVVYAQRSPDRPLSRMVRRPPRPSRRLTVIGYHTAVEGEVVIYTAYGGELAYREPGDPTLVEGSYEHALAVSFWLQHALALPESFVEPPVEPSTESAE